MEYINKRNEVFAALDAFKELKVNPKNIQLFRRLQNELYNLYKSSQSPYIAA